MLSLVAPAPSTRLSPTMPTIRTQPTPGTPAPILGARFTATWHDFRADEGGAHYGDDIDAEINWRPSLRWLIGLKYADYQANDFAVDTRKAWLWVEASL